MGLDRQALLYQYRVCAMKTRFIRYSLTLGEGFILQFLLARPAVAQTATPSSQSTASALPEAGIASLTVYLVLAGIALAVLGILLSRRTAKQQA